MDELEKYTFLKAGLEDAALAARISGLDGNPRHAVNLMHDSIEFVLYEVLQMAGHDIYSDGQNTIGLNSAISKCAKEKIDLPLVGTIRSIQKHRGDAKHHAQVPHEKAYSKMIAEFQIVLSRLVHEHFGIALASTECLQLIPYHTALFDSYRKYRTHNWTLALRFALGALLHKHRALRKSPDDYTSGHIDDSLTIIGRLESEIKNADTSKINPKVTDFFAELVTNLRLQSSTGSLSDAAEMAGKAYARIDEIIPSVLIANKGRELTPHLIQTLGSPYFGARSWVKWWAKDTKDKNRWDDEIRKLLRKSPSFVKSFGQPYYDDDDDRYWKWWEFAVFDGIRWHTFHMDDGFYVSLESGSLTEDDAVRRERVSKLIVDEFTKAVAAINGNE